MKAKAVKKNLAKKRKVVGKGKLVKKKKPTIKYKRKGGGRGIFV